LDYIISEQKSKLVLELEQFMIYIYIYIYFNTNKHYDLQFEEKYCLRVTLPKTWIVVKTLLQLS